MLNAKVNSVWLMAMARQFPPFGENREIPSRKIPTAGNVALSEGNFHRIPLFSLSFFHLSYNVSLFNLLSSNVASPSKFVVWLLRNRVSEKRGVHKFDSKESAMSYIILLDLRFALATI